MKNQCLIGLLLLLLSITKLDAQAPVYNSYPAAQAVIFLDFDGQLITGTNWNMEGPLFCGPANLNATQTTEIFNRVAEDFRPFNINVTTDSAVYEAAPVDRRIRVLLTISSAWYGVSGGVAYTNSFTWGNNTPCFVFTALHKYNVKNIAEAASHEAGHTLGLRHQAVYDSTCRKVTDYNGGVGSGAASWAPIMGMGYYRNKTTWHVGPNPYGCANEQDDLAIITSSDNGFGYRADDNTATDFASAALLNGDSSKLFANGLISTNTDTDLFQIAMPARGALQLQVLPNGIADNTEGANLDVQVALYDKNKNLLATYNPAEQLSVRIDTVLPRGTYYVEVQGAASAYTTRYASLGAYKVRGSVPELAPLPENAVQLTGAITEMTHRLRWSIHSTEPIKSQVVEQATNGGAFTALATVDTSLHQYTNNTVRATQYRVHVTFDDDQEYYTSVLALESPLKQPRPQLATTVIHSNAVQVASPASYKYTIINSAGQRVQQGRLQEGTTTIYMDALKKGIYIITFENNSQRSNETFVRQ